MMTVVGGEHSHRAGHTVQGCLLHEMSSEVNATSTHRSSTTFLHYMWHQKHVQGKETQQIELGVHTLET